jgi:hypothetical protein
MEKDEYFQVDKSKKILDINLPVQIGYLILQYAKFRMLQFYWSFWTFTSTEPTFAYYEMDTVQPVYPCYYTN